MLVLNGKEVSKRVREELAHEVEAFAKKAGRPPGLAVVLVGEDPASQVYVRNKHRACEKLGMKSWVHELPVNTSKEDLKTCIESLNSNDEVDAFLVQLPLPQGLDPHEVTLWIDPQKDADGLTPENMGLLWSGRERVASCTPAGVMEILKHYDIDPAGQKAVVIGRSQIVGKPMAHLLQAANATVTVCHSRTKDVSSYTKEADLVVVAAGQPRLFGKEDFKKDAVVVDVGIHRTDEGLCGDVRFEELEGHIRAATPVPGGVGPMTITMLLKNTLTLAKLRGFR